MAQATLAPPTPEYEQRWMFLLYELTKDGAQYTAASAACTGAIDTAATWKITKVGNVVTLTLPSVQKTSPSAAASFAFGTPIPAQYRPSADALWITPILDNSANVVGAIHITAATGIITVYANSDLTTAFTASGAGGIGYATGISWTI